LPVRRSPLNGDALPLYIAVIAESFHEGDRQCYHTGRQETDSSDLPRRLRLGGERRSEHRGQAGEDASSSHEASFSCVLNAVSCRAQTS
jgi:hypothetical protein